MTAKTRLVALIAICVALANGAEAAIYHGYVPRGFLEMHETWPGDASQILRCQEIPAAKVRRALTRKAARQWRDFCVGALKVHRQFLASDCYATQWSPVCRTVIAADNAIRHDPEFWRVINAMMRRQETYGLELKN
jgi:hypothetical protein